MRPESFAPNRFKDKVAIVTGSGQGIGFATALRLGLEGARIVIADLSEESAAVAVKELALRGIEAVPVAGDLTRYEAAQRMVEVGEAAFGAIHVLVNNVGGTIWKKPFWYYREDEIRLEVERSFWPPLWCCRAVIPVMRRTGGAIVNVGSNATEGVYRVPYSASKGAVAALTTSLANELVDLGIRVNCVEPGATDVQDRRVQRNTRPMSAEESEWEKQFMTLIEKEGLIERFATVEEQASVIAFLASDEASHVTGETIGTGRRGTGLRRILGFIP